MVSRAGVPTIILVLFISLILVMAGLFLESGWSYLLYIIAVGASGFILFFFRDPERDIPKEKDKLILAPADGKIISIRETEESKYLQGKARCVSIFLSAMDVHVNRYPVSGVVEYLKYHPGKYLVAWNDKASDENERAEFGVKHESGTKIFYKQITGIMARRIVYNTKEGQEVSAGDRFGIMKFGSRMDIFLPMDIEPEVKEGDRTVAGESVIARFTST